MPPPRPAAREPAVPRRRIGLFGGSFDPIHRGHLHAARAARDRFDLDRVVFVPAAQSPFKPGTVPAPDADRLAMVELAIAGERAFEASDLELRRGGRSFTIDTVRALPAALGEPEDCAIHLILGSDNLPGLPGWRGARELLERVQPVVVHRAGQPDALLDGVRAEFGDAIAEKLRAGYLRLPPVEASSTDVRERLARAGAPDVDLPPRVMEYVRARGLYGTRR